jgi:hypothetical protein
MKKNLNHMTFHRIFFIKKKEKLLFHWAVVMVT